MLKIRAVVLAPFSAVVLVVASLATPAEAVDNVLTLLPEQTLGFAVVNRLFDFNEKLGKHAEELEFPVPDLLAMAKATVGMNQGIDDQGTLLLAVVSSVDGSERIQDAEVLIAVPVSDYQQFVQQLGEAGTGDASDIAELNVGGMGVLAAEKTGHALLVLADSERRALLTEVLSQDTNIAPEVSATEEWIAKNDAAIFVLSSGLQQLTGTAVTELEKVKQQFANMEELGAQGAQVAAAFDMYLQMLHMVQAEVTTAACGLTIDDGGNLRLGSRVRFTEGGRLANISDASNESAKDLLAGLPGEPFVGAASMSLSPESSDLLAKWSVAMMKSNPALYGMKLSDEAAEKYLELTRASMKGLQGFSMMISSDTSSATMLEGIFGIIHTDDATDYLNNYGEAMGQFQVLMDESDSEYPYDIEVSKAEIAGAKGVKVVMDMAAALAAQGQPAEAAQMLGRMFGEDGKLTAHVLAIQKKDVLFSYGSEQTIARRIAALKSGGPSLAEEESIAKSSALLPDDAAVLAYLSPRGAVSWIKKMVSYSVPPDSLADIPVFPGTPAVGFSAKMMPGGLETELVVPAELPKAIKEFVGEIRQ